MGNWNISKDVFGSGYTARPSGGGGSGSSLGCAVVCIFGTVVVISLLGMAIFPILGDLWFLWLPLVIGAVGGTISRAVKSRT